MLSSSQGELVAYWGSNVSLGEQGLANDQCQTSVPIRCLWLPGGNCGSLGEQCLANNQCQMSVTIGSLWLTGELVAPWSSNVSQTINIIVCYNRELGVSLGSFGSVGEQCLANNQYYLSVTFVFITLQISSSVVPQPHLNLNSTTIHPL